MVSVDETLVGVGRGAGMDWLLKTNKAKITRERKHMTAAKLLPAEDARDVGAMLLALQDAMAPLVHPELLAQLFSKDCTRQADGLRLLADACADNSGSIGIVDNADLLMRLCALRIVGARKSPLILLTVLHVLHAVLGTLAAAHDKAAKATVPLEGEQTRGGGGEATTGGHSAVLTDYEGMLWVPLVVELMGSNHLSVRDMARRLVRALPHAWKPIEELDQTMRVTDSTVATRAQMRQAPATCQTPIFPAAKLLGLLLERGKCTRNQRARLECVREASALLQHEMQRGTRKTPAKASLPTTASRATSPSTLAAREHGKGTLTALQVLIHSRFEPLYAARGSDRHAAHTCS